MTVSSDSLTLSLAAISPVTMALVGGVLAAFLLLVIVLVLRGANIRREQAEEASFRAMESDARMAELLKIQAEMQGRLAAMTEVFGARQSELNQSISQRLDGMSQRVSSTITEQTKSTHENLRRLQERLAVIDAAQNNIQTLAKDVVGLQSILSNKQTRGAFGQSRMETIVADGLPMGAYTFQPTLSNGLRPDCTIRMPNGAPPLVIDAKFPLESWNAIRDAGSPEAGKIAGQQFRRDMEIHIRDISEKYLIQGETQDTAFLFVPSESIFAEVHENFEPVVQKAHRLRIVIVSPSLLMLSIQVIQSILKDARMREQAHLIQGEVIRLMEDVARVDERVRRLQTHFTQSTKDIDDILVSTSKVTKRGQKIEALEFAEGEAEPPRSGPVKVEAGARVADSKTGQLRLRVVEGDE